MLRKKEILTPSEPGPRLGLDLHMHLVGPSYLWVLLVKEPWPLEKLDRNGLKQAFSLQVLPQIVLILSSSFLILI
jgi:hypothetical protein